MRRLTLFLALAAHALPVGTAAQSVDALAAACTASAPSAAGRCTEAAVAARALAGHTGLLEGLGSHVPGASSTLGRRLGSTPRVALSVRGGGALLRLPDLTDRSDAPARQASAFVPTLQGSVTLGVFDGFMVRPTVGGFLSLDVIGQTAMVFLPSGEGFRGKLNSLTLGARVGLIRESFTLPGVTFSVARHIMGNVSYADATLGDPAQVDLEPSATSYRLVVGKDLFALGLLAGVGWDDYDANATLLVNDGPGLVASTGELGFARSLVFGGASMSFLVLQLSAEVGWARGYSPASGYLRAPHDPTKGTIFGSLAARLTI